MLCVSVVWNCLPERVVEILQGLDAELAQGDSANEIYCEYANSTRKLNKLIPASSELSSEEVAAVHFLLRG